MTNWERYFGTPDAAMRIFDSREEYLAWLKSERCGE